MGGERVTQSHAMIPPWRRVSSACVFSSHSGAAWPGLSGLDSRVRVQLEVQQRSRRRVALAMSVLRSGSGASYLHHRPILHLQGPPSRLQLCRFHRHREFLPFSSTAFARIACSARGAIIGLRIETRAPPPSAPPGLLLQANAPYALHS